MPRASPIVKTQNAGEWSKLLEGRIDLAKYPASLRRAYNVVITPQGPTVRRSGTKMETPIFNEALRSYLLPFIYDNDQALQVEFANGRLRFLTEFGPVTYTATAVTAATLGATVIVTSPGHGVIVGDQIAFAGFLAVTGLNSRIANVTSVVGNVVGTDVPYTDVLFVPPGATIAKVYAIASPYPESEVQNLRYVADQDTLFLFNGLFPTTKLQRFGGLDWRITTLNFIDGPYAPVNDTATLMTPSFNTGNVVPTMTGAAAPSGVASASTEAAGFEAWHAFDSNRGTYWEATTSQAATLQYQFAAGLAVNGYLIEMAQLNNDVNYRSIDFAPGDWTFEGSPDGATWTILDRQIGYVLYDNGRSVYFPVNNIIAYPYYRLNIIKTTRNGTMSPRVATFAMTSVGSTDVTFDIIGLAGVNNFNGFLNTDVGRLIRFKGSDGVWRPFKIEVVSTSTRVLAKCMADPLLDYAGSTQWRLGLFSTTTGFPTCGTFFEDRLCMGGMSGYPDYIACSVPGKYEVMQQTNTNEQVVDDNALVLKLNSRKQGRVMWLSSDLRALLAGTGSNEWAIASADPNAALSARTAKARPGSRRGSASIEPLQIDSHTLFVQRASRTLREMSYVYELDGYKSPSLSLFSSHLGTPRFMQLEYAAEPHAMAFIRRGDGTVAALTYNKDEDVVGWQILDFNGFVECISVIPSADGTQDALWMIVRRVLNGVTRRFVERMTRFWDFDSTILDAYFVDCHLVYNGPAVTTIVGLGMYENVELCGVANGSPIPPTTVVGGQIELPDAAYRVVLGIGYDSEVEVSRIEAGAVTGTAQGKPKRINEMRLRLWETGGGQYAVRTADGTVSDYVDLEYLTPDTPLDSLPVLFSGDTQKLDMPQAFSTEGTILYRQLAAIPLPMNVTALMPVLVTQDG